MKKITKKGAEMSWLDIVAFGSAKGFGGLGIGYLTARFLKPKQQQQAGAVILALGFVCALLLLSDTNCKGCKSKATED